MQSPKLQHTRVPSRNLVLIGAPGAGKGTQARRLQAAFQIVHISTGEMLRAVIQSNSTIGSKVRARIESGQLVSDELVLGLVAERLRQPDVRQGYVLDGFPRTEYQAAMLDEILAGAGARLDACIYLTVDPNTIVERINERSAIENRVDDNPATIRRRIEVFEREIAPLVEYYRGRDLLMETSGMGNVDEVAVRIHHMIGSVRVEVA